MIDNVSILFSTVMVMLVVLRAVNLDRRLPWFGSPETAEEDSRKRRWQPRSRSADRARTKRPVR